MAMQHSKNTVTLLNGKDLSTYTTSSQVELSADTHDVTTYGKGSHVFAGGLKNGTGSISGIYDTTAVNGPRAVILPLVGLSCPFVHRPEGTGTGKPQDSVTVIVTKYTQTHPVADMVTWTVDLQFSDDVNSAAQ
jgi:hypothetical protein